MLGNKYGRDNCTFTFAHGICPISGNSTRKDYQEHCKLRSPTEFQNPSTVTTLVMSYYLIPHCLRRLLLLYLTLALSFSHLTFCRYIQTDSTFWLLSFALYISSVLFTPSFLTVISCMKSQQVMLVVQKWSWCADFTSCQWLTSAVLLYLVVDTSARWAVYCLCTVTVTVMSVSSARVRRQCDACVITGPFLAIVLGWIECPLPHYGAFHNFLLKVFIQWHFYGRPFWQKSSLFTKWTVMGRQKLENLVCAIIRL